MHIGAPACGMNAAVRSFVRNCIYRGDTVYGVHDGIDGLVEGNVSEILLIMSLSFNIILLHSIFFIFNNFHSVHSNLSIIIFP